jgi:hypothetical protein
MADPIYYSDGEHSLLKAAGPFRYVTAGKGPSGTVQPTRIASYGTVSYGSTVTFVTQFQPAQGVQFFRHLSKNKSNNI